MSLDELIEQLQEFKGQVEAAKREPRPVGEFAPLMVRTIPIETHIGGLRVCLLISEERVSVATLIS